MSEGAPKKRRWRRRLLVAGVVVVLVFGLLAFLLPYILKRTIERNSEAWIGRRITIDRIVLNPFTLTYGIYGFTCHEPKSDAVFVSWSEVSVHLRLIPAWRNNAWRFRDLVIDKPYFHITQNGDRFNFSDLMELASADSGVTEETASDTVPMLFSIENIKVNDGTVDYTSDLLRDPAGITGLHAECTRISSQNARMDFTLGCALKSGGDLNGSFTINTETSQYGVQASVAGFELAPLLPYLQELMYTTELKGALDLDVDLVDSWADTTSLACSGIVDLSGLKITDAQGEELIGCALAHCGLDTLNAREQRFQLRTIAVDGFRTRYEMFSDSTDTWSRALRLSADSTAGDSGMTMQASESNILVMLADYVRMLGRELIANEYSADSIVVSNGSVQFNDFTPEQPFRYTIDQLSMHSTRFGTASEDSAAGVQFVAEARLNGKGHLTSRMDFDPHDFRNVEMSMEVTDLALQDMDAYCRWYAAHPLMDGVCTYATKTRVKDGKLDSENTIHIDRLTFGEKAGAHAEDIYILPLRLAASLLKDVKGVINLDVPVKGDLNDPDFKVWPVVWKVLKNLVTKAVAAPVKLIQGAVGGDEKDLEQVRFEMLQKGLGTSQYKALEQLAAALKAKPELAVALVPVVDPMKEQDALAAFEARRGFLGYSGALTAADSARINELSLRDTAFVAFLNERSPATKGLPEADRCRSVVGGDAVMAQWNELERSRGQAVLARLTGPLAVAPGRVALRPGSAEETNGWTGAPGYRFIYDAAP
jgi:hypothetical protein